METQLHFEKTGWLVSKKLLAISIVLFVVQALSVAALGAHGMGPAISDSIQLALGFTCVASCIGAISRSQGMGRNVWRLFAGTFSLWVVAQAMGVYVDVTGSQSLEAVNDTLFFLSVIPLGALPFLDPNGKSDSFDKLHILDFVQVCVVGVSILLSFSPRVWSPDTAFEFGPFVWSRNCALDGLLVATFTVRALCSRHRVIRSFYLRMALFLFFSGLADSYALHPRRNLHSGGWFDLVWSSLLAIPILIACTWETRQQVCNDAPDVSECLATNRLLPLLYPTVSFAALAYVGRTYPLLSLGLFTAGFFTFAVRVLVIQDRLKRSEVQLQIDVGKRAVVEQTLRESEVQYRLLFESNPVPMWVFDRKTLKFLQVNEAAIRHYQYSREEFLSMTIDQIRPKDDVPALLRALEQTTHGLQEPARWRHLTKSGELIDVEIVGHSLQFLGKDAELVAAHDVTERNKAAETAQRLASIAECSQDAIIGTAPDGVIVAWNRGAEKMYGCTSTDVIGQNLSMLFPTDKHPKLTAVMDVVRGGKSIEGFETQTGVQPMSLIDVSLSISPIKDALGRVVGTSIIARDVSLRKRSEEQLKLQSAALEAAANAIVITDSKGIIQWVNQSFTEMTGYDRHEIIGRHTRILKSGQQKKDFYTSLWTTIMAGKPWSGELVNQRKDGATYTEEMTITPVTHESNGTARTYFIAIKRDVTERRRSDEALILKTALLEGQTETTIDGILVVDEREQIILTNKRFGSIFGIPDEILNSRDDLAARNYVIDQIEDAHTFIDKVKYLYDHREEKSRDELKLKNGKVLDRYSSPLIDAKGTYRGRIWYFRDITDRRLAENRVQYLAYYDALTSLPNRVLLQDRLTTALAGARRRNTKAALLFLDLDNFKLVNDSLGHSAGDILLQQVSQRLKGWAREQDTVARLGGDEFLIVLNDVKISSDAAIAAERLMDVMAPEFLVHDQPLNINCSLGISVFPEHGAETEELIKNADAAMYCAKENGRNNYRFFTESMNAEVVERLTLGNSLRGALAKEELFLVYQPQMHIATRRIIGLEALLRWQHPELGLVPPNKFIPVAENSGLIVPIGEWVLRTACSQVRKWQDAGLPAIPVAVNVSAAQFRQEGFLELVKSVLEETGLSPQYLELELTESLLMNNTDVMLGVIRDLKALGVAMSIDDFGTGYSSLSRLRQFQVNRLKIDQSFVRDVNHCSDDATIATAIISMAKSLNLKVMAEGVETEDQLSFLAARGCDEIQGYYFSKPLPASDIPEKLKVDVTVLAATCR